MAGEMNFGLLNTDAPAQAAVAPIKGVGAVNALISQDVQNQQQQFELQNALAEREAYKQAAQGGTSAPQALMERGLGKQAMAYQKNVGETQLAQMKALAERLPIQREMAKQMALDPSPQTIMGNLDYQVKMGWMNPQQAQTTLQSLQGKSPQELSAYFTNMATKAEDFAKHLEDVRHNRVTEGISGGNLAVSRGHLALAQQNAASPEAQGLISKAILEGRLDPNKVNSRNRNVIAATLMADPNANLRQLGEEAAGGLAGARSIGTQEANVSMAASEARKMITLAEQYSSKVDRTQYPSINAISNAVSKGTGDPNIVQLDAALNSLVNVYARAINPKGVATVADKKHAREIIDRNYSAGQLSAAFQVMDQEMAAAQSAGKEARKVLRGGKTELSGEDKAAAEWAKANPNDPKAAKIRQHLGL